MIFWLSILTCRLFQSTPSLRRATLTQRPHSFRCKVSIHALLAESDSKTGWKVGPSVGFNPRPPCGERPVSMWLLSTFLLFQSTPSLRRATGQLQQPFQHPEVSIHALLAESDHHVRPFQSGGIVFQSTPSLRRATIHRGRGLPAASGFNPRPPCGERPRHFA